MSSAANLMPRVIAMVGRVAGPDGLTVDDLLPYFHGSTREQVMNALSNAKYRKRIEIRKPSEHMGVGLGTKPASYGPITDSPAPQPEPVYADPEPPRGAYGIGRVSSVWDLGGESNDNTKRAA